MHASVGDAEVLLRAEAATLLACAAVEAVTVTGLRTTLPALPQVWDWLVEIELGASDAAVFVEHDAFTDLMAELRSLGMHPVAALVDRTAAVSFSRAGSR